VAHGHDFTHVDIFGQATLPAGKPQVGNLHILVKSSKPMHPGVLPGAG
jgi:hypothetical protein